jgi:hypothetical protein
MIKPQDKVFANLITQLQRDLPREPLTRVVNLAAIALGIVRSKSLQVGQIITAMPLAGTRDTLKKRVQRFLKNPDVTVELYYEPLARRILQRLASGGARIHLTIDRTEWSDFNILYVCVGWRGRALPLLGGVLGPGASSFAEQQALLALVAGWLPRRADVLLLGDREFGTGVLAHWALRQGWGVKPALREAFGAEPKALAIIGQEFQRRAGAVAKDVDRAAQRIVPQRLPTQGREAIDPLAEIDGVHGQKDATLGSKLQH